MFSSILGLAQIRPYIPSGSRGSDGGLQDYPCGKMARAKIAQSPSEIKSIQVDSIIMMTHFDLQTCGSISDQRLYYWPSDNTMAACAMFSRDSSMLFPGTGTGYNYFNGNQWGAQPVTRVESVETGWPSIQPYGVNGECLLSHQYRYDPDSLVFSKRMTKGTGTWTQTFVPNPPGEPGMMYPRMVIGGADQMSVNIIAITPPSYDGGTPFNGMECALLYIRSTDGGVTWGNWQQLPGMTSAEYLTFVRDSYAWANPRNNTLCFFVSNNLMDAFIMKSTDNGDSWTKTVIYSSPYNLTSGSASSPGWFYCPDGSCDVALDNTGTAHVTFALECDHLVNGVLYHQPLTNGIIYWNESMPSLGTVLIPDTLKAHNQFIGWITDSTVFNPPINTFPGGYYGAIATNPSMTIDDDNNIFVVWMATTSEVDPNNYLFAHIFERTGKIYPGYGVRWLDPIIDLTGNPIYYDEECVYPSLSPTTSGDKFFMLFQRDNLAGVYALSETECYNGQETITDNYMTVMGVLKSDVGVGMIEKRPDGPGFTVSDNYPNPFRGSTTYIVNTGIAGNIFLEIDDLYGQPVSVTDKGHYSPGTYHFTIDAGTTKPGIYFCTVKLNNVPVTKKMIVY